jgi:MarR family transcriptional regulator, organic hydroperoxide resistance regulator
MSHPELLLANQICHLVYRLDLAIGARYRPLLESLGLTYGQYLAMLVLWEERETDIGTLCERLGLDTGTVSPLMKRLEKAGLVSRRRAAEDERVVRVSLTGAGADLEAKARVVPLEIARCLVTDREDHAQTQKLLRMLIERAEGGPKAPPAAPRARRRPPRSTRRGA